MTINNIYPEGGERMMQAIIRKSKAADEMFANMIAHMNDTPGIEKPHYITKGISKPSWLK